MDWNRLKKLFPDKENKEEGRKIGRRSVTDADPSKQRQNYSKRGSFNVIKSDCPNCGHHKALDKTSQDVRSGIQCSKCKTFY